MERTSEQMSIRDKHPDRRTGARRRPPASPAASVASSPAAAADRRRRRRRRPEPYRPSSRADCVRWTRRRRALSAQPLRPLPFQNPASQVCMQ